MKQITVTVVFLLFSAFLFGQQGQSVESNLIFEDTLRADTLTNDVDVIISYWKIHDVALVVQGSHQKIVHIGDKNYTTEDPFVYTATRNKNSEYLDVIINDSTYNEIKKLIIKQLINEKKIY